MTPELRSTRPKADPPEVDLVLEGGGMKGLALIGALAVLDDQGYEAQNMAGTSAGAIVAALYAAGYTPREMRPIFEELVFTRFMDNAFALKQPLIGVPWSILRHKGIFPGKAFLDWLAGLLREKGVERFGDLVIPESRDQLKYRYRVQMIASDVTSRQLLVLPHSAERFGIRPDDLSVAHAVRMSMSFPVFFQPYQWTPAPWLGGRTEDGRWAPPEAHLIVDGGLLSNFPVWLFDSEGRPPWPTFGLKLVEAQPRTHLGRRLAPPAPYRGGLVQGIRDLFDFGKSIGETMLEAQDRRYIQDDTFARTIPIETLGVRTLDFGLSAERKDELYESGRTAARKFLRSWDFERYIRTYRTADPLSRRERIRMLQAELPETPRSGITPPPSPEPPTPDR